MGLQPAVSRHLEKHLTVCPLLIWAKYALKGYMYTEKYSLKLYKMLLILQWSYDNKRPDQPEGSSIHFFTVSDDDTQQGIVWSSDGPVHALPKHIVAGMRMALMANDVLPVLVYY